MLEVVVGTIATLAVIIGTLPVFAGGYQFVVTALSLFGAHYEGASPAWPRVSVLIPAWNEGAVVEATIRRLLKLDYPPESLRIYVVDDASNDETPHITRRMAKIYPDQVFHIRRVAGGEGKAHTLNYGLEQLLREPWTEAFLIMDADVIYTESSLRRMARHLADPLVGAVTAYIREGSRSPNYVQRFITFEYITATGASRRAQNALGFLACLSGGAQLHSRENMDAIGGKIFDDTLAEDTFTTFATQLNGRKALFEPNAIVYAEEPDSLDMLWKQRLRWARGNVQVTGHFKDTWFRRSVHDGLGSASMGVIWFSLFLMPVFQIATSIGLLALYWVDPAWAWSLFEAYWIIAGLVYVLITLASLAIDPESAAKSWLEGILFPGLVSLAIIVVTLIGPLFGEVKLSTGPTLFLYLWTSLGMAVSYLGLLFERKGFPRLGAVCMYLAGYGAFLCAITLGAYQKEFSGAARTWDKTVKTGKVG